MIEILSILSEVNIMATPISHVLVLEGEDARRFDTYMEDGVVSEGGMKMFQEVMRRRKALGLE